MTVGEDAGWEYIRVVIEDLPITQRDVAEQFGVSENTVRANYKKILRNHGFSGGAPISEIKKMLKDRMEEV